MKGNFRLRNFINLIYAHHFKIYPVKIPLRYELLPLGKMSVAGVLSPDGVVLLANRRPVCRFFTHFCTKKRFFTFFPHFVEGTNYISVHITL